MIYLLLALVILLLWIEGAIGICISHNKEHETDQNWKMGALLTWPLWVPLTVAVLMGHYVYDRLQPKVKKGKEND